MKSLLRIVQVVSICLLAGSAPMALRAQTEVTQDELKKLEEARTLYTSVRDAYTAFSVATLPKMSAPYVSLTVAARRFDSSSAILALAINTNDPGILAEVPGIEINVQPVVFEFAKLPRSVGTPVKVQLSKQKPRFFSISSAIRELSMATFVPQEADGINVQMTLIGRNGRRGLKLAMGLTDQASAGTAALHSFDFLAVSNRKPASSRFAGNSFAAPTQDVCQDATCVPVSVTCGSCTRSASCNVCDPNDQPQIICNCSTSPCSCGIVCRGGCT